MESLVIILFAAVLIGCVILNINLVIAMVIGYVIFVSYAKNKGFSFREIGQMSLSGILTVRKWHYIWKTAWFLLPGSFHGPLQVLFKMTNWDR